MIDQNQSITALAKAIGLAVRYSRDRRNMSQEELAELADLDRSYLSQIERGVKNATIASLFKISKALETPVSGIISQAESSMNEEMSGSKLAKPSSMPCLQVTGAVQSNSVILIVDDCPEVCLSIETVLQIKGFSTKTSTSGMEAMASLCKDPVLAVISDIFMDHGSGIDMLLTVQKLKKDIPIFLMSGSSDYSEEDVLKKGAKGFFRKPVDFQSILHSLDQLKAQAQ